MAGLKLKSGADFCNFEAFRMRLHNAGEDPTSDFGVGQIYFNTSDTSVGSARHVRLYDGTKFRSLAYLDEIAKNEAFLALKERVDLLSGDVDTDAIISNMKEVSAFLEGFAEDASLMGLLNGKFDKAGGTITGYTTIRTSSYGNQLCLDITDNSSNLIRFQRNGANMGFLGFDGSNKPIYANEQGYPATLLHSGNYSNYALPKTGGTIDSDSITPLILNNKIEDSHCYIMFKVAGEVKGYVGWSVPAGAFLQEGTDWLSIKNGVAYFNTNTLLHSGNIGSQIVEGINNHSGEALDVQGNIDNLNAYYSNGAFKLTRCKGLSGLGTNNSDGIIANWPLDHKYGQQWYIDDESHTIQVRYVANAVWSDWKTIAFTDSNVASASKLETPRTIWGQSFDGTGNINGDIFVTQKNSNSANYDSGVIRFNGVFDPSQNFVQGPSIRAISTSGYGIHRLAIFQYNSDDYTSESEVFSIMPNGNVGIGTTEPYCLLEVAAIHKDINPINIAASANFAIGKHNDDGLFIGHDYTKRSSWIQSAYYGTEAYPSNEHTYKLFLNPLGGNVLIGTTDDNGAKLQVSGDLHVTGNIIADGEVSAGGRAEEGGNAGGGGAFHSESIAVGATQTTIAHGLGTDDIVVSIYEKDGVSGRWSIILTDVEIVDANNIIVSFGSATSVEHKVVIMGAVA